MTKTTMTVNQAAIPRAGTATGLLSAKQHKLWSVSKTNAPRFKPGTPLGGDGTNAASCNCDGSEISK